MLKTNFYLFLLIAFIIIFGLLRITSTYGVFWQLTDEPAHLAKGMEWLDRGTYTYETLHPPLAPVMNALGPYLDGVRGTRRESPGDVLFLWDEGNKILHANGAYERNLTLARLGTLPFFIIASVVVALWANMYGGTQTAILSVVLFTTLPSIIAHSSIVSLDLPCAALVGAALFVLCLWLNRPTLLRSILLGITVALAILTKFSAILFLIVAGGGIAGIYGIRFFQNSHNKSKILTHLKFKKIIFLLLISFLAFFLIIWASYRFSYNTLISTSREVERVESKIEKVFGSQGSLHDAANFIIKDVPFPAPEFIKGISQIPGRNKAGSINYLWGEVRTNQWWYYYPVVIFLKTPLAFTVLTCVGIFVIIRNVINRKADLRVLLPIVAAIGIMVVGMLSNVNNGTRQILSLYLPLAIVAGYGTSSLLRLHRPRYIGLGLITVLMAYQLVSSLKAHPDYLAYFNELAGRHPEEIVVSADLSWGQDVKRFATILQKYGIKKYSSCSGFTIVTYLVDIAQLNIPQPRQMEPYKKITGWLAISADCLKFGTGKNPYDQYSWLKQYQPVEQVGKSIWLYYIEE